MAIINGQLANADEVLNAMASNFVDNAQLLFNADYIGFDSRLNNDGVPQMKNVEYDAFTSDSASTTNFFYNATDDLYQIALIEDLKVLDNFDDASIDTNIWNTYTTGSGDPAVTETDGYIEIFTSDSGAEAALASDNDIFTTYGNYIKIEMEASYSDAYNTAFQLITGSASSPGTKVSIVNLSEGDTLELYKVSSTEVKYRKNDGDWTSKDVSTLASMKFYMEQDTNSNADARTRINWIRYGDENFTSTLTAGSSTSSATITNAILVLNNDMPAAAVYYLSADNGSNYEAVTPNEIHRFTNTGTQPKIKVEYTQDIDELPEGHITEYAVKYNLY